jgi:hypothetical protein
VYLGQLTNTEVTHLPNTFVAIDGGVEWDVTASMVARIRRRLHGRKNYLFRDWVELHTGHVQSKLLRIHIDNLVALREAAGPDARVSEMTRLYMRELGVREGLFDPLYHGLLERIYDTLGEEVQGLADEKSPGEASDESTAAAAEASAAAAYARLKKA